MRVYVFYKKKKLFQVLNLVIFSLFVHNQHSQSLIKTQKEHFFFLLPSYHDGCSWQGAVPHLRQEDSGCKEDKYNLWVNQLQAPTCHEKWKAWAGIQADSKDDQTGQREIADPRQQLPVLKKSELAYHAMLVKIGVHHYSGHNTG